HTVEQHDIAGAYSAVSQGPSMRSSGTPRCFLPRKMNVGVGRFVLHVFEQSHAVGPLGNCQPAGAGADKHQRQPRGSESIGLPDEEVVLMWRRQMPFVVWKRKADIRVAIPEHRSAEEALEQTQ